MSYSARIREKNRLKLDNTLIDVFAVCGSISAWARRLKPLVILSLYVDAPVFVGAQLLDFQTTVATKERRLTAGIIHVKRRLGR